MNYLRLAGLAFLSILVIFAAVNAFQTIPADTKTHLENNVTQQPVENGFKLTAFFTTLELSTPVFAENPYLPVGDFAKLGNFLFLFWIPYGFIVDKMRRNGLTAKEAMKLIAYFFIGTIASVLILSALSTLANYALGQSLGLQAAEINDIRLYHSAQKTTNAQQYWIITGISFVLTTFIVAPSWRRTT